MHAVLIAGYLLIAGTIAGFISAVAGLASLISYPVLLSIGVPPVSANVTNTAALIFTGLGSTMASGKELHGHRRIMWHVALVAMAGGIIGCLILAYAPSSSFEKVVPFMIFGAGVAMLVAGQHTVSPKNRQRWGSQTRIEKWRHLSGRYLHWIFWCCGRDLFTVHFNGDFNHTVCCQQCDQELYLVYDQYIVVDHLCVHDQGLLALGGSASGGHVYWRLHGTDCGQTCAG